MFFKPESVRLVKGRRVIDFGGVMNKNGTYRNAEREMQNSPSSDGKLNNLFAGTLEK